MRRITDIIESDFSRCPSLIREDAAVFAANAQKLEFGV